MSNRLFNWLLNRKLNKAAWSGAGYVEVMRAIHRHIAKTYTEDNEPTHHGFFFEQALAAAKAERVYCSPDDILTIAEKEIEEKRPK